MANKDFVVLVVDKYGDPREGERVQCWYDSGSHTNEVSTDEHGRADFEGYSHGEGEVRINGRKQCWNGLLSGTIKVKYY